MKTMLSAGLILLAACGRQEYNLAFFLVDGSVIVCDGSGERRSGDFVACAGGVRSVGVSLTSVERVELDGIHLLDGSFIGCRGVGGFRGGLAKCGRPTGETRILSRSVVKTELQSR